MGFHAAASHPLPISALARLAVPALALGLLAGCGGGDTVDDKIAVLADPVAVQSGIEGCKSDGVVTLPDIGGRYVCPDALYTSGNLGKNWNELDLVPHRVTLAAGHSAPATQTYSVAVALDNTDGGKTGYDIISAPRLNAGLSHSSCRAPVEVSAQLLLAPGIGGLDSTLYRLMAVTQARDTTCVYDFYGRLALGSSQFPGSALHANLLNNDLGTAGIGAADVPLPVDFLPPGLAKSMSATQDSNQIWGVGKSGPASVSFGDVCAEGGPQPQSVEVTVTWTKLEAVPGMITAVATITATNTASRPIGFLVADSIYDGPTAVPQTAPVLDGPDTFEVYEVPARSTRTIATHTAVLEATAAALDDYLSDIAVATFVDPVGDNAGVPIVGEITAMADTQIQNGMTLDATVTVGDREWIAGSGLQYSADAPTAGYTGYVAGTPTADEVVWTSAAQGDSGSQTFGKTLYLGAPWITGGTLSDVATLTGSEGFSAQSSQFDIAVSSFATTRLTINKSIPEDFLLGSDTATVTFRVTRAGDADDVRTVTLVFSAGGDTSLSETLTGLAPDTYTVTETSVAFSSPIYPALSAQGNSTQVVNLNVPSDNADAPFEHCSGSASFVNVPTVGFATAKVQKVTQPELTSSDPDYTWTFTLSGPGVAGETVTADAGAGDVAFQALLREGTYTVTETPRTGWDQTSPLPNCTFSVDYPADDGKVFGCAFTNAKRGHAEVIKTYQGAALSGTLSFGFDLRRGASSTAIGTILETQTANAGNGGAFAFATLLKAGDSYQLCETGIGAGWMVNFGAFVPAQFNPPAGTTLNPAVDNSTVCVSFTVAPGETRTFTIDNTPPPATSGGARTIGYWKNWSSCSSGRQAPVLDRTLASFPDGGVLVGDLFVDTCTEAVALLNKSTLSGKKMASDPAFNMAAQLMAAVLNVRAGAATCPAVTGAINQAQALLDQVNFNGQMHGPILAANARTMNSLATTLDRYNNNLDVCS